METYGLKATWFATHKSRLLEGLSLDNKYEIGIHPNFNPCLERSGTDALTVLGTLKNQWPDARSIRSHSLTQSTKISKMCYDAGLTHEVNHYIPYYSGMELNAWYDHNYFIKVPFNWEDDISCLLPEHLTSPLKLLSIKGLKILSFHPIHLFLNTVFLELYEAAKPYMNDFKQLKQFIQPRHSYGVRDYFIALVEAIRSLDYEFGLIRDIVPLQLPENENFKNTSLLE